MKRLISAFAVAATVLAAGAPTTSARADDSGRVAAGIAGGFLGGLLLGGALAPRPYPPDAPPPPSYGPPPGYVDYGPGPDGPPPPQNCRWTRGQPVWDDAYGVWRRPRIQVCD